MIHRKDKKKLIVIFSTSINLCISRYPDTEILVSAIRRRSKIRRSCHLRETSELVSVLYTLEQWQILRMNKREIGLWCLLCFVASETLTYGDSLFFFWLMETVSDIHPSHTDIYPPQRMLLSVTQLGIWSHDMIEGLWPDYTYWKKMSFCQANSHYRPCILLHSH